MVRAEIFTGRLNSDIRSTIPTKEEYLAEYVRGLEEVLKIGQ